MYERWRAFASRFAAEWRKVVAGDVLLVVALVAHLQGWTLVYFVALFVSGFLLTVASLDAVWPDDPDVVKEPSRRW